MTQNAWLDAWRAEGGKEKQVQRPGIPREELGRWVVRAQTEGGAKTAAEGLKWVRGRGLGVGTNAWRKAWRRGVLGDWSAVFEDEDPFPWEWVDGVGEGDVAGDLGLLPVDWGRFAEVQGWLEVEVARLKWEAAQLVSSYLFAPRFVGVRPPERVVFDLVVDQVAVTLHQARQDGVSELEAVAAARTHAEMLAEKVRDAGLAGAPDWGRTAWPSERGVGDVSSVVGGAGQREPLGGSSQRGAGQVYPGRAIDAGGVGTVQDGSRPWLVELPMEVTPASRPQPLLFAGPGDSVETIAQAERSVPVLPGTQIVGVHVTPGGLAVLRDGREVSPEVFADEVRQDPCFVPGLTIALLGCAANRLGEPGQFTFAQRFARALCAWVWTTIDDVVQTMDKRVHATLVTVAGDGTLLPRFENGLGIGHWELLGSEGESLWTAGAGPGCRGHAGWHRAAARPRRNPSDPGDQVDGSQAKGRRRPGWCGGLWALWAAGC
ncbi:hypothetical protein [Saccharopolyspora hattusasensis]|uniref:hypothetical protein n=1 Tax=Saccharopolyspora hattusasensis TaxID=1128679 RepID=UPI003D97892C